MRRFIYAIVALLTCNICFCIPTIQAENKINIAHAIAMDGQPKYPQNFTHFEYTNPDAPKMGKVNLMSLGSFDSFNPFISKGQSAAGIGYLYDTLMTSSSDEPFTKYGLIAEKIEYPDDRSYVIFHLNPKAKFNDGEPITSQDVIFTFNTLVNKGAPFFKQYYAGIDKVTAIDKQRVRFDFKKETLNRELILIVSELPVLPAHSNSAQKFDGSLTPPLGNGPYKIKTFKAGRYITYERVKDYWAQNLPTRKGIYNFDEITYKYYRDPTIALEAFKSHDYDFRAENSSKLWATAYTGSAFENNKIIKTMIPDGNPDGMQGFVFNLRKPIFQNKDVRKALNYAFDFEWTNKILMYNQYKRTRSYFENSELATDSSKPPSAEEKSLLQSVTNELPAEILTQTFSLPKTDGSGQNREQLKMAADLLTQAGYVIKDGKRVHKDTGEVLEFEIPLVQPGFKRIILPFSQNLEKLGIKLTVHMVDYSQYIEKLRTFDYDMIVWSWGQSLSPGNEQYNYWHSSSKNKPGSYNFIGLANPAIDKLVEMVVSAPSREALIQRTKALDRALLWGYYVIPHWYLDAYRVAYWNQFGVPKITPKFSLGFEAWWQQMPTA